MREHRRKWKKTTSGIRKRLLEYDDVMNKQRNVVYKKRNHALFGERLALDLDNAFYGVAEGLVTSFKEQDDYEGFKLAAIMNFGLDTQISASDFKSVNAQQLSDRLYQEATEKYQQKMQTIGQQAVPVFQNIRSSQGNHIENVVVPFTDGRKGINVLSNMQKTLDSNGRELTNALERTITLALIDDSWKEHLRAMDDLKQSVQTAYLEQKDPLVIYKMEAFDLFRKMDGEVNREIVSFLAHCGIPMEQQQPTEIIKEGREEKTDMSKLQSNKEEVDAKGMITQPIRMIIMTRAEHQQCGSRFGLALRLDVMILVHVEVARNTKTVTEHNQPIE